MTREHNAGTAGVAPGGVARGILLACCGLVLAALPVFLVGGLAVQIRAELGFSEAALGAAVTAALLTAACAGPVGGRVADRIGVRAALLSGAALSVVAMGGIAAAVGWWSVAAFLVVAGLGVALTDPGLAILLARAVPARRQGLGFGVKEASIPLATLAAGLAVPGIALTVGWRWAFLLGAVPLAGVLILLPRVDVRVPRPPAGAPPERRLAPTPRPAPARLPSGLLLLVAVAAGMGMAAASGVGVFLTQSAVAMGVSPASAGLLLATGSVGGIVARVLAGVVADRAGGRSFGTISWMLAAGAVAMALGASGNGPLLVLATLGTFAGGWGWTGLLFLSLVRANPAAPGAAAGVGLAGLAAGNGLGPLLFGVLAQESSFGIAWASAAGLAAAAALLMRLAHVRVAGRFGTRTDSEAGGPA